MCIAIGGKHFHYAGRDVQYRDIKGPTAQIVNGNLLFLLVFHSISQSGSGGFIDYAFYLQPGNASGVLGGLALIVVKVCRNGDHSFGNRGTKISLGSFLHLGEDDRRDLLRGKILVLYIYMHRRLILHSGYYLVRNLLGLFAHFAMVAPHETLDREYCIQWIGYCLTFCVLTYQALTVFCKANHGGSGSATFRVGYHDGFTALNHGNTRVCGSQINSNYLSHLFLLGINFCAIGYRHAYGADHFIMHGVAILNDGCHSVFFHVARDVC